MRLIDRLIFGSGHGLAMPASDQRIYWLVDRKTERGTFYTFCGGFGAQLRSFQWTHPRAQEERVLSGVSFRPFCSHRQRGRVEISWSMVRLPENLDAANFWIRSLEKRLGEILPGQWPPEMVAKGSAAAVADKASESQS